MAEDERIMVGIRMTEDQRALLKLRAMKCGMSVQEYILDLVFPRKLGAPHVPADMPRRPLWGGGDELEPFVDEEGKK